MKKLIILVAIMVILASVVSLNAQVNIWMPPADSIEHLIHAGDEDNLLFINIQNSGQNPVIIQSVFISTMNLNLMAPTPDISFRLCHNEEHSSPVYSIFDISFINFNDVIEPGETVTYHVKGLVSTSTQTGASFKLGLSGPGNIDILEQNTNLALTPTISGEWGNQWTVVGSPIDPQQPMHRMDIYPYRNPTESISSYPATRYVNDEYFMYPGQEMYYYGAMNPMGNSFPNSIVTMDSYVSIFDTFNQLVPGFHYWQTGNLNNLGLLYTQDFEMTWVANGYEGIDTCGLFTSSITNNMQPGQTGQVFTSMTITNNTPVGLVQENCIDNKTIISNIGVIGDINGTGFVDQDDPNLGIQQWINQEILQTSYNPADSINIMRQVCVAPHLSSANIWAINGAIHYPQHPFFSGLHIGEQYTNETPGFNRPTYNQNGTIVSVDTSDNFASIFWRNPDGSFGGQDILITENRAMKWTLETGIEPVEIQLERTEIQFQLPAGAEILSISSKHLDYSSTANDDQVVPLATPVLKYAYPNPFNATTSISYNLPKSSPVQIEVYNVKGQLVKTLENSQKTAGDYSVIWDGKDQNDQSVSAGMYFYKMKSGMFSSTKKMILMK